MKPTPLALALALAACLLAGPADAQTAAPAVAPAAASADPLFGALGGKPGIDAIVDDLVPRLFADEQVGRFFAKTDRADFRKQLADQVCSVAGGPCKYEGATMKKSHADFQINKAHFNRVVELLQASMDVRGVPFADQNRLLARLAPMHRDVITVR